VALALAIAKQYIELIELANFIDAAGFLSLWQLVKKLPGQGFSIATRRARLAEYAANPDSALAKYGTPPVVASMWVVEAFLHRVSKSRGSMQGHPELKGHLALER